MGLSIFEVISRKDEAGRLHLELKKGS